ncbi:MAG: AAA family ATPase [Succinivibrionaceae bacterium]
MGTNRIVIGIVNNKHFSAKNGNDCAFIDIGFEKFTSDSNSKDYEYEIINQKSFFCESNQVFLTSNALDIINSYNGMLIQLEAGDSPNPDSKCNYTALYSHIKSVVIDDFIEIIKTNIPSPNNCKVYYPIKPSTKYVMFENITYIIDDKDVDFLEDGDRYESTSRELVEKYIYTKYVESVRSTMCNNRNESSEAENVILSLKSKIINDIVNDYLEEDDEVLKNLESSINVKVDEIKEDTLLNYVREDLKEDLLKSIVRKLGEAKGFLKPYDKRFLVDPEHSENIIENNDLDNNSDFIEFIRDRYEGYFEKYIEVLRKEVFPKIKEHRCLMGPFCVNKIEQKEDVYTFEISVPDRGSFKTNDKMESTTKKFDYDCLTDYIKVVKFDDIERAYLVQLKNWQSSGEKVDYISEKKLVDNYCTPILGTIFRDLRTPQLSILRQNSRSIKTLKNQEERVIAAFSVIENAAKYPEEREKFFNFLLQTTTCKHFIDSYIRTNSAKIVEKYRKDMIDEIKHEGDRLKKEIERLNNEINKKRFELKNLEKMPIDSLVKENNKKANSEKQVVLSSEIENLKSSKSELTKECNELRKEVENLASTKEKINKELKQGVNELSSKYLDMHSMLRAFTSSPTRNAAVNFSFTSSVPSKIVTDNISKSRNRYIEELTRIMRSRGRNIERNKLISMVITIAQNQFTILAGLPGSGKTSFVKTLGKSLNLGNRLHTIPVARGWTSQRDILGYWNSLAGSFQAAPTGLWELLTTLNDENDSNKVTPVFLLLDEMNLSSPEHYFSSFMDLADDESERMIYTGSPEKPFLKIPSYIRFIGTVNSDDTVNIMSPRMLDRSAVILFEEKPSQADDFRVIKQKIEPMSTYSAKDWEYLFNVTEPSVPNVLYTIINQVEELLFNEEHDLGQRVVISYRKHQQILNYLTVAIQMFDNNTVALDFAMKQFVLPVINGFGEGFRQRLNKLKEIFENNQLNDSVRILSRIISEGEDRMHSYQFLA